MKKITILLVWALLCLNICGRAQEIKALNLGQKIPAPILMQKMPSISLQGASLDSLSLNKYKGKLILLDFWAAWCSTCITKFGLLESLQEKYADQFKVILVNTKNTKDTPERMQGILNGTKAPFIKSNLTSIYNDVVLSKLLPHTYMPFYVWLGTEGEVLAITGAELLTDQTVDTFLAGITLQDKQKQEGLKQ